MEAEPKNQIEFVAQMFYRAFPHRSFVNPEDGKEYIWLRAIHYYIVSLPEEERMMPGRGGLRLYENQPKEWKKFIENMTKARLRGLVPMDKIWDARNAPMAIPADRSKIRVRWVDFDLESGSNFTLENYSPKTYEDWLEDINITPNYSPHRFKNQIYEVVVITEKKTVQIIVGDLCKRYGASLIACKGQSSTTRVYDMAKRAQEAKRPVVLLGLFDLDCAGWDMGPSVLNKLQKMYPHKDHKFVRVVLTRDLAEREDLPDSFEPDDKGYPDVQKQRFYEESGGTSCIELDSLSNPVIYEELEKALKIYCRPNIDKIQERRFKKKFQKKIDKVLEDYDFEQHKETYTAFFEELRKFYEDVESQTNEFQARFDEITERYEEFTGEIESDLRIELGE